MFQVTIFTSCFRNKKHASELHQKGALFCCLFIFYMLLAYCEIKVLYRMPRYSTACIKIIYKIICTHFLGILYITKFIASIV